MRIVREINHPNCKITVFSWNNRYLIKLEQGFFEQTFKINETDLAGEQDLDRLLDDAFIQEALDGFRRMAQSLYQSQQRNSL